jgi:hypothetical protein
MRWKERALKNRLNANARVLRALVLVFIAMEGMSHEARATVPNTVSQWNKIAEDTVVGSGAFQNEGLIYIAYVSAAVYEAVVAIEGTY